MAHAAPAELQAIASIAARRARLVGRLEKFSFPLVAAPLAGLLTRSENHTATARTLRTRVASYRGRRLFRREAVLA